MSGDELIYYSLKVQRLESRGSGKDRRAEWITQCAYHHCRPFYLVDVTGLALVSVETPKELEFDPQNVKVADFLPKFMCAETGELDITDPRIVSWSKLTSEEKDAVFRLTEARMILGFPPSSFLFGIFESRFRIVESAIPVGSPLYAQGDFRTLQADTPRTALAGLTEFHSRVFDSDARSVRNLNHFLDKNRDGKVTDEEARNGYAFAASRARANKPQAPGSAEKSFPVFGKLGSSLEHPLLLADLHQSHLLSRKGRFVWLEFIGGAILIALAVSFMASQL